MNKINYIITGLFLSLCLAISIVNAQESLNIELMNRYSDNWNDGVYDVVEQGENYYMACGADGLRVIGFMDSLSLADLIGHEIELIPLGSRGMGQ